MMAALMVATLTVSAQDYNWAVGVRGGGFSGITAKKNLDKNALEFGASFGVGNYLMVCTSGRSPLSQRVSTSTMVLVLM